MIDALADRTTELSRIPGVEYVFCFENRGEEIGVTLSHPNGQIYGYPFVPPRMQRAAAAAADYRDQHGECLRCELLRQEVRRPPADVTFSEETEQLLPELFGGLSVALARSFRVIDPTLANPATEHWERAFTLFRLVF